MSPLAEEPFRRGPVAVMAKRVDWSEEKWGAYFAFYEKLLERVDADIGEALHQLRCSGFLGNTWILFAADHGDMAGEHGLPFKGPFGYEGVTRVPLIIVPPQSRFGGPQPAGSFDTGIASGRRDHLCGLADIVPTILDLAGLPPVASLPGRSLLPVVREADTPDPHEFVFAAWHQPGMRMVCARGWKYICHEDGAEELFDLKNDPAEARNLATQPAAAEAKTRLLSALATHLKDTNDPRASRFPQLS